MLIVQSSPGDGIRGDNQLDGTTPLPQLLLLMATRTMTRTATAARPPPPPPPPPPRAPPNTKPPGLLPGFRPGGGGTHQVHELHGKGGVWAVFLAPTQRLG